jgi:hypothetical protein
MKYIISEEQSYKFLKAIVNYANMDKYEGVCRIEVDEEPDEDGRIWLYAVHSKEWLDSFSHGTNPVSKVNKTRKKIRESIKEMFGIDITVGSYFIDKCDEL